MYTCLLMKMVTLVEWLCSICNMIRSKIIEHEYMHNNCYNINYHYLPTVIVPLDIALGPILPTTNIITPVFVSFYYCHGICTVMSCCTN